MTTRKLGAAERAYHELRALAVNYDIKPGERINEVAVSKQLGVSRTPLREALNRLEAEGFLTFSPKLGFFRRKLEPREIFDLIEIRSIVESAGARLAAIRASDAQLHELRQLVDDMAAQAEGKSVYDLIALDEAFHEFIITLSGNGEMVKRLRITNARIRFIRWGDLERAGSASITELQRELAEAILRRDAPAAAAIAERQALRTMDEIIESVRLGYGRIFMRDDVMPSAESYNTRS